MPYKSDFDKQKREAIDRADASKEKSRASDLTLEVQDRCEYARRKGIDPVTVIRDMVHRFPG